MWKFDGQDVRRLRRTLRRAKQLRWFKRVQAVLLVAKGLPVRQAADLTGQKRWSLYRWIDKYRRRHRPQDLEDRPRAGRPKAAATITPGRIRREMARSPLALGYMATEWTVPLLAGHLSRRYDCPIGPRTLRRRLKELGLVWRRPRYVYHLADPNRGQKKGR